MEKPAIYLSSPCNCITNEVVGDFILFWEGYAKSSNFIAYNFMRLRMNIIKLIF